MSSILILFHCGSNTGYAIKTLEDRFFYSARKHYSESNIFISYLNLTKGNSDAIPDGFNNIIEFDPNTKDTQKLLQFSAFIKKHKIKLILGFDQTVRQPYYKIARQSGVHTIIAYWGASMCSLNSGVKLLLKKIDVAVARHAPNHYIFESQGMENTATHGRGIPHSKTSIIHLGVDENHYQPDSTNKLAYKLFHIPRSRRILFFSGHMEPRKGVSVIMEAAKILINEHNRDDVHFLLLGNKPGEEKIYLNQLTGDSCSHVTFGGYRNDIHQFLPSCYVACIASTGWDSFTMSSIEMASCGLPLIVSDLPGLSETVDDNSTGFRFPVGDARSLAEKFIMLLDNPERHQLMSNASRKRVLEKFTRAQQISKLADIIGKFKFTK